MVDLRRRRRAKIAIGVAAVVGVVASLAFAWASGPGQAEQNRPGVPADGPPVLAGQQIWGACAGGFYARLSGRIVLTSSGHCTTEGTVAYDADGTTVRGVFGPAARVLDCPVADRKCFASDMNYLVVADDQVPWGKLNVVDLGDGGLHVIPAGTTPLACDDVEAGDIAEINGRNVHRAGAVEDKGEYLRDNDGDYFPCMVAARIPVEVGDSGAGVLVGGTPGGVASRSFGGLLGFTPLAEGLDQLGLELCTTSNCDLVPPSADPPG